MNTHFVTSAFLLAAAAIAIWIGYRRGFFRYAKERRLVTPLHIGTLCTAFALYFGFQLALGYVGVRWIKPETLQQVGYLQMAILGVASLALFVYQGKKFLRDPLSPHLRVGALCFLLAFPLANGLGQLVEGILVSLFGQIEQEQLAVAFLRKLRAFPLLFTLSVIMTAVVVPIAEEILFRGLLQGWLRKRMGAITAIFFSAAIFTAVHLTPSQQWTNFTLIAVIFPLGACLGYLYERQRSLWAPIALHALFNGVTMLGLTFGV